MTKRLSRSLTDRWLAGVCGGIADFYDIDPSLVRLLFVIFALFAHGLSLVVYLVMWVVVPEEGQDRSMADAAADRIQEQAAGKPKKETAAGKTADEPTDETVAESVAARPSRRVRSDVHRQGGGYLFGLVLVVMGALLLVNNILPDFMDAIPVVPLLIILLGILVLFGGSRRRH